MSKEFIKGNTYVFTKKKFVKSEGRKIYKESKDWVDECNGNKVINAEYQFGVIRYWSINPAWCKCVKVQSNIRGVK
ncbi:MAG: hypothetical protein RR851_10310 [Clostridium sp.]